MTMWFDVPGYGRIGRFVLGKPKRKKGKPAAKSEKAKVPRMATQAGEGGKDG